MKKKTLKTLTLILLLSLFISSCTRDGICMKGNGKLETKEITTSDFHKLRLEGDMDVSITQGEHKMAITIDDNLRDEMDIRVRNNECIIGMKNGCFRDFSAKIEIAMPDLTVLQLDGSGNIDVSNFTDQKHLNAIIDGSGDITFNEITGLEDLDIEINGSGNVDCDENIDTLASLNIEIKGSGNASCFNAKTEKSTVKIMGSGNCEVHVLDNLDATIQGSGNINYKGYPSIQSRIDGSGNLRDKN